MWRAFRFGGMFKGGRFVTERDVNNKIKKIDEYFDHPVIKNSFIPAAGPEGSYNPQLAGLVFVEYDDDQNEKIVKTLREMRIEIHSVVTAQHVENIRNKFNEKHAKVIDIKNIEVGDVVLYSGMECMVNKINGDTATIMVNIFGVSTEMDVQMDTLTKKVD
jgi:hypothetical protein